MMMMMTQKEKESLMMMMMMHDLMGMNKAKLKRRLIRRRPPILQRLRSAPFLVELHAYVIRDESQSERVTQAAAKCIEGE